MQTPSNTSETLYKILQETQKHESVIIFTHVNPDGDTIGTAVALKELILLNTSQKNVFITGDAFPSNLQWLGRNDQIAKETFAKALAILVDCSTIKRCFNQKITRCVKIIKIDHHPPEGSNWFMKIDGDHWPATGQILGQAIMDLKLKFSPKALEALFVSVWTDTSGLTERLPTTQTLKVMSFLTENKVNKPEVLAKLEPSKAVKAKVEKLVANACYSPKLTYKLNREAVPNDVYRAGAELFFKRYNSQFYLFAVLQEDRTIRVGFRSKVKDVSRLAQQFNGGGHRTSAGTVCSSWDQVDQIVQVMKSL